MASEVWWAVRRQQLYGAIVDDYQATVAGAPTDMSVPMRMRPHTHTSRGRFMTTMSLAGMSPASSLAGISLQAMTAMTERCGCRPLATESEGSNSPTICASRYGDTSVRRGCRCPRVDQASRHRSDVRTLGATMILSCRAPADSSQSARSLPRAYIAQLLRLGRAYPIPLAKLGETQPPLSLES
jgi:hypothetical protein